MEATPAPGDRCYRIDKKGSLLALQTPCFSPKNREHILNVVV